MQFSRPDMDDPERLVMLEHELGGLTVELIADAADAGYSTAEFLMAMKMVCERQYSALAEDPDPADDPV
jgi:hypothetical protein